MFFNASMGVGTHLLNKSWILTETLQELCFQGKN